VYATVPGLLNPFTNRIAVSSEMTERYAESLWAQMAIEARNMAARIHDPDLRLQVLLIAARYMVLAKRAKKCLTNRPVTLVTLADRALAQADLMGVGEKTDPARWTWTVMRSVFPQLPFRYL
jgi:hypothetical protein